MKVIKDIGQRSFVSTYEPTCGHKSVLLTWDEECNMPTPWNTGFFAHKTWEEAMLDAILWAQAEDIPVEFMGSYIDLEGETPSIKKLVSLFG